MKACPMCGQEMPESNKFCSISCSNKGRVVTGRRNTRTLDGGLTWWCPACETYKPMHAFHPQKGRKVASRCKACRQIERKARYVKELAKTAETPKTELVIDTPKPIKPRGSYNLVTPKKNVVILPPEKLRYAANPCHVLDGYALAMEFYQSRCADPWVRGWFSSVPKDADGYVQPRFETEQAARMWNEFIAHRTGVRA